MRKILAFDIGGTNTKFGILNEKGEVLSKGKIKTKAETEEIFLSSLLEIIKESGQIEGIAISMPGFIDAKRGVVAVCYAIRCMEGKSIATLLNKRTGLKVTVENDGNCAALAEKFNGNAKECDDFICATIGTGVGGGIFINGKIVRGNKFRGGEFGFMVCNGLFKEKPIDNIMSVNSSTRGLIENYKKLKNIEEEIDGQVVFKEGERDLEVKKLIEDWYFSMALGLMNLSSALNPEKILIGGAVSEREEFISSLEEAYKRIPWWKDVDVQIERCYHKNDAGLIGAVYNYLTI